MKIIFTLCSCNYLAQAKTLGDSIMLTNPDYQYFIGLTDRLANDKEDYKSINHTIIPVEEIGIPDFEDLWKKYTIIEFNTCVKPFYFQYFICKYPEIEYLYYFDPDTFVYGNLKIIEKEFGNSGKTLITPHINTPINLGYEMPEENRFLIYGIYNLGFLGFRDPGPDNPIIAWWKDRTFHLGYNRTEEGLFVDQLWFNFVPIFFDGVIISKHPGLNMAPWNLHERTLNDKGFILYENDNYPLVFYHFSNYKYTDPSVISRNYPNYDFSNREDLKRIYDNYYNLLISNGIQKLAGMNCYYMIERDLYLKSESKKSAKGVIKLLLKKVLPEKVIQILKLIRQ